MKKKALVHSQYLVWIEFILQPPYLFFMEACAGPQMFVNAGTSFLVVILCVPNVTAVRCVERHK